MAAAVVKIDGFKNAIGDPSFQKQVKAVLKDGANSFVVSMLELYSSEIGLQNCNPAEVAQECLKAALLKLPLVKALGFAYVVTYKNKPTFTIGYKGLIQLAQRTGQYKCISADAVYEGELVSFNRVSGEIDLSGERTSDNVVGYFAYMSLVSGFEKTLYMTRDEVDKHAKKFSPSYSSNNSPWKTNFDRMAMKTVLRRLLSVYGALTVEVSEQANFAQAMEMDDRGVTPMQEIQTEANSGNTISFDNEGQTITEDGEIIMDAAPDPADEPDY